MSETLHRCSVETTDRLLAADNLITRDSGEDEEEEEDDEEEDDGYSE
jgi:hypothetical protein